MARFQKLTMLPLSALGVLCTSCLGLAVHAGPAAIGEKGANVYCYMRRTGNSHEVSWDAAYQIIKRQKSSLFKTSPKHAAVMITETVVQNPDKYDGCGSHLGELFAPQDLNNMDTVQNVDTVPEEIAPKTNQMPAELKKGDRYSY